LSSDFAIDFIFNHVDLLCGIFELFAFEFLVGAACLPLGKQAS
jgi:hypothetical protein